MTQRTWPFALLLIAAAVGVFAARVGGDACLIASLVLLVGLAVIIILVARRAQERLARSRAELMRAAQMCPHCGYTIRVATDRCPECGEPTDTFVQ